MYVYGHFNDHQIWEEQMKAFSGNYLVVSYDLRGYGNSETPSASFSNVEDLRLLLDTLKVDKVNLVGSSMGGSVAVDFSLAYPDRVHRLILAAPSINGRNYPVSMFWQGIKQHIQIRLSSREKAIEAFIAHPFWQYYFPDRTKESARQKTISNVRKPENFCRFPPQFARIDRPYAIHRLEELHCPVLIFIGERDHPLNRRTADILKTRLKNATLMAMPNCGHLPFIEEPERFNLDVAEFLEKKGD